MAIIKNVTSNVPDSFFGGFLQVGGTDSVSDVGIRSIANTYVNLKGRMKLPEPRSSHPVFIDLILTSATMTSQEAGLEELSVVYTGQAENPDSISMGGGNEALFKSVTSLSKTVNQQTLDTHPNFTGGETSIIGVACDSDGTENPEIIIRDTDGAFVRISDKAEEPSLRGASSYLAAGQEFTVRYASRLVPNIGSVGKIVESPAGAPSVSGDYNWLLLAVDYSQEGDIYEVTERYQLSGEFGWEPSVYNYSL